MTDTGLRVFSYGGGVQSNAVLALQAAGKLPEPYDVFAFANVGADSENPATLRYVEDIAKPFAGRHQIPFVELHKVRRGGETDTLLGNVYRTGRSVPLPVFMSGGSPGNRTCTSDFKINVIDRWIKAQGVTHATIGLGISLDEFQRVRDTDWHDRHYENRPFGFMKRRDYPLIDLRLRRSECRSIITDAGMPMPSKSSCYFCPFKKRGEWLEMKRNEPELFEKAVALEQHINVKRGTLGRDRVFLHPSLVPLDQAVGDQPALLDFSEMDNCESGYCHV